MACASMSVGAAAFLLMPAGILIGGIGIIPKHLPAESRLVLLLDHAMHWVTVHSLRTAVLVLGIGAIALYGVRWTSVETDFTKNFREDSQVLEGYRYVEAKMGGVGFVELAFEVPREPTSEDLDRIRRCADRLRTIPGVTKVTGLCEFLDFFSPRIGARTANGTPSSSKFFETMQLQALRSINVPEIRQVWNTDAQQMRLVLRVREQQSTTEKALLLTQIETIARQSLGTSAQVTGLYVLLVNLIDGLLADQWLAIGVSAAGLLSMMTYAFRSLRLGIVAFLPNLIPLSIVIGTMGWLGLKLNVATAMIQSISMGLAIDFSIHYLTRFTDELKAGADFYTALSRTHQGTGRAMVSASLALICGFGVLTFSNFLPTIHFGMLVSIAMIGGLVGSLVTLPVLLRLFYWVQDPPPSHLLLSITSRVQEELAKQHGEPAVQQP
jgi:predicted RND superfamily exporter protein